MAKHHKRLIAGLVAVAAISAMVIWSPEFINSRSGAEVEVTDNVRVVEDRKLPEKWAINAAYGRGALSNLQAALGELANENTEEARRGIVVAQSLLGKIEPVSLNSTIDLPSQGMTSSKSVTENSDHDSGATPDLILVHSEVRFLGDADPENAVQAKLDSLRRELDMTDHEAIVSALDSLNVPLTYTRIDLPLSGTITLVNEVMLALDAQDSELARTKLLEIGSGLHIDTVNVGIEDTQEDFESEFDAS